MALNLNRRGRQKMPVHIKLGNLSVVPPPKNVVIDQGADLAVTEVASVIVTICAGGSYDMLFRNIPQESEYGKVAVYLLEPGQTLEFVMRALQNESVNDFRTSKDKVLPKQLVDNLKQLKQHCDEAGSDAVCFNFECCGGYSANGFWAGKGKHQAKPMYIDLIAFLVTEYGCMTMFSDFSLKALITDWDVDKLGPNPFFNAGEFGGKLELAFEADELKKCPSAQLNTVGDLCKTEKGHGSATLHAMPGTIAFTITEEARQIAVETEQTRGTLNKDADRKYIEPYEVQVLTIAETLSNQAFSKNKVKEVEEINSLSVCEIGSSRGLAGHVLLTYPPSNSSIERFKQYKVEEAEAREKAIKAKKIKAVDENEDDVGPARGMILASCGHWIELMKIDVSVNRLLETVKQDWGATNRNYVNIERSMAASNFSSAALQTHARDYVHSRMPAQFNRKNMRFKKKGF